MSEISVGDVVTFKSGGPAMTVADIGQNDRTKKAVAVCMWFDKNEQVKNEVFNLELLAKVE